MKNYIKELWKEPNRENLTKVYDEMRRNQDIITDCHYVLTEMTKNTEKSFQTDKMKEIYKEIDLKQLVVRECREIIKKINESLEEENNF